MRLSSPARRMSARISSAPRSHSDNRSRLVCTASLAGERLVERGHAFVELVVGDDERRHEAHHGAAGHREQHALLARARHVRRRVAVDERARAGGRARAPPWPCRGYLSTSACSALRKRPPASITRSSSLSFSMVSITASAAAQASGLPPKVDACEPGAKPLASSSVATMQPMGTPPASPLASDMTSGVDALLLVAEEGAGAADAGLHLVEDEHGAGLVHFCRSALQEVGRRHANAALGLDRLDDAPRRSCR